jgi:cytochrome P450
MAQVEQGTRQPGKQPYGLLALPNLVKNPLGFFVQTMLNDGDLVQVNVGPLRVLIVHHPDHVRYVLQDNWRNFGKGSTWIVIRKLMGNGLLGSEGDFWLRQRRLMQPAFHKHRLATLADTITATAAHMLTEWEAQVAQRKPIEIAESMSTLTMQVIVRTLFGSDVAREDLRTLVQSFSTALRLLNGQLWTFVVPGFIPLPGDKAMKEAISRIDAIVYRFIEQRRQQPGDDDLISVLLDVQDADTDERMTDQQVRDEVFTMFLAGHETSATVLSWIWYLLWQHPDAERRFHQELETVLGGRLPTFADLPNLRYTRMVINEAMRLYPPAWFIPRTVMADDVIGDVPVKAGTFIMVSSYAVHRHPDFWEDAERFDPERFAASSEPVQRHAYLPFGEGPRMCIGNNFALMEMQLIMATLGQRYRLSLKPGTHVRPVTLPVLRPAPPVWMHALPRQAARGWSIESEKQAQAEPV